MSVYNITDLLKIMADLRNPDGGCPWDLEQNFASITPHTLEEAYEVVDAIEQGDMDGLKLELGDLLLQVIFYAQMAKEERLFTFEEIIQSLCEKLVRRHPHVFGDEEINTAEEQESSWEMIKQQERNDNDKAEKSVLADIPKHFPALTRAAKLQKRAAKVGFDWEKTEHVFEKMQEELQELNEAVGNGNQDHIEDELGDVLFVVVNIANRLKIDPETALRNANNKFMRRFHYIEQQLSQKGLAWDEVDLATMDAWWNEAKQKECA